MPELPEVEITRRALAPHFVGRRIREVITAKPSYFFLTAPTTLRKKLVGRTITSLDRHGKYLLARLDDQSAVLLHLGMTGRLSAVPRGVTALRPHTHLRLRFDGSGPDVSFEDVRKFGKVKWLAPNVREKRLGQLGPDALCATAHDLHRVTRKRRAAIKGVLLDQSVIAGIGNIYADEALYLAGIRPSRPANRTSAADCEAIVAAARTVMLRAIEAGGSTIRDFVAPDGHAGSFQNQHLVYSRTGQPCPRCGTKLCKKVIATRSSHYCPTCQK